MKRQKQMRKAFGNNEFGQADLPVKISNVQLSRITNGNERGCSWCFPHGFETNNSTVANRQHNWSVSKTRWKPARKRNTHDHHHHSNKYNKMGFNSNTPSKLDLINFLYQINR